MIIIINSALIEFNFWESYIFYIYILKLIAFIYFISRGIKLDKKDSLLAEIKILEQESEST